MLTKRIKKLPDVLILEIFEYVIYKPKSNEELKEAVKLYLNDLSTYIKKYGHISLWNTSNITDMSCLFYGAKDFNEDISWWNTSNVTNMYYMFAYAKNFNQPLAAWDTSNVTNMSYMFYEAENFNQPLADWNTRSVTN